jgi:hypothetical protein
MQANTRIKDENGGLPCISLHLYVDSGPKRARILNFGALFDGQGFQTISLFFFVSGNCWNCGKKIQILLI